MANSIFRSVPLILLCSLPALPAFAAGGLEVHGHRGARARFPENTIPAFEYAVSVGVDALELDMAVTKDDQIVISHDPHISPVICVDAKGQPAMAEPLIHDLTLKEVKSYDCGTLKNPRFATQKPVPGTRIPTLDEVFTALEKSKNPNARKVRLNIETKIFPGFPNYTVSPEKFVQLMMQIVRKHHLTRRIILESFDPRTLIEVRKIDPTVVTAALVEDRAIDMIELGKRTGANIISPDWEFLDAELVRKMHEAGFQVLPWTVNTEDAWKKLTAMKVDGIISDDPAALIEFLKKNGLR